MKNVMTIAWEIAREGVEKFGGNVKEYFAESLRLAWKKIKEVGKMIVSKWKNANGVEIEMHTEQVNEEWVGSDVMLGDLYKKVDKIQIVKLVIGGEEVDVWNTNRIKNKISTGKITFRGRPANIDIALPKEIESSVWGEYDKHNESVKAKRNNHICPHCGSYCWGDCQAN